MKKSYQLGMILCAILTVLGLTNNIYLFFQRYSSNPLDIIGLANNIVMLFTVFYTVAGYKKPHGNLLKILMLVYALLTISGIVYAALNSWLPILILETLKMSCIAYVAGRLDGIKQNKYLMLVIRN